MRAFVAVCSDAGRNFVEMVVGRLLGYSETLNPGITSVAGLPAHGKSFARKVEERRTLVMLS